MRTWTAPAMTDECLEQPGRTAARTRMVTGATFAPQETQRLAVSGKTERYSSLLPRTGIYASVDPGGEMVTPVSSGSKTSTRHRYEGSSEAAQGMS